MYVVNILESYKACICVYDRDKSSKMLSHSWALGLFAFFLYFESLVYFIITNIYEYEYCYALYGLRLITVLSCIIATLYIYSAYNDHMFDWASGSLTVINLVFRFLTIIGFIYCIANEDSINQTNIFLSGALAINIFFTVALLIAIITSSICCCCDIGMCASCCDICDYKKKYEDKLKELENKELELQKEQKSSDEKIKAKELELRNYEAKLRDESINIAIPVDVRDVGDVGDVYCDNIIKYEDK